MSVFTPAFRIVRPLVNAAGMLRRGLVLGVRVVIEDGSGRVMLVRHSYERDWHFPGGGVERGETCEEAGRREAREEAGCDPGALTLFGVYNNETSVPGDHVLLYRASQHSVCTPRRGLEIVGRDWFSREEAARIGSPATQRRLGEVFGGETPSLYW